jgi:hypothetical protein
MSNKSISKKSKKYNNKSKKYNNKSKKYKKHSILYGGSDNNEKISKKIMNEIHKENTINWSSIKKIPLIGTAINNTEKYIEQVKDKGIEAIENKLNIDLDNPNLIQDKLNETLENKQLFDKLENQAENAGNTGKLIVAATAPVVEELLDKTVPAIAEHSEKIIKSLSQTGVNLLEDFLGPVIGIPRTLLTGAEAVQASVNAGSEIIKDSAEAIEGSLINYKRLKEEQEERGTINGGSNTNTFNKYQTEKVLIGGRIHQSRKEFILGLPIYTCTKRSKNRRNIRKNTKKRIN